MAAARARPRFAKGLMCHMGATTPSPNVTTNEQLLCKGSGCKTIGNPPLSLLPTFTKDSFRRSCFAHYVTSVHSGHEISFDAESNLW